MPHASLAPPIAWARSSAARSPTSSSPKATFSMAAACVTCSSTAGPSISRSRLQPRAAAAADGAGDDRTLRCMYDRYVGYVRYDGYEERTGARHLSLTNKDGQ